MLKKYLKDICTLEQEILERQSKIGISEKELERSKKAIEKRKEELRTTVDEQNEKLQSFNKHKAVLKSYVPEGISTQLMYFVVAAVIIVVVTILMKLFVVNLFNATDALSVLPPYLILYFIPVFIIWLVWSVGDNFSWGFTIGAVAVYGVLNFLTWGYYNIFETKGHTITYALYFFMGILLVIDVIIGVIVCLAVRNKQNKKYYNNQRWLRNCKPKHDELTKNLEVAKKNFENYNQSSQKAIEVMLRDIKSQKFLLNQAQNKLKSLYSQNKLHPNYQNWVAAATIYEYLDEGICKELQGTNGAYRLYREEVFQHKVLDSLGAIRSSINVQGSRIAESQQYIRNQLIDCQCALDRFRFNTHGY